MDTTIVFVSVLCLIVNVPLGVWREHTRKFSFQWILAIHASIPLIIALRIGLKLHPVAIPINIVAAVLGQLIGSRWERRRLAQRASSPASN
jgi:hypothetical protein